MNINIHDAQSINITPIKSDDDGETNWFSILIINKDGHREEITFFSTNQESLKLNQVKDIWSI